MMIVESFSGNIICRGAVVFEKGVKQWHENNFRLGDHETKIILACKTVFFHDIVLLFSHITAPHQLIF